MHQTTFDVPFDAQGLITEERSVLVVGERVALRFDRDSHAAAHVDVPAHAAGDRTHDPDAVLRERGLRVERRWTSGGPVTFLFDEAGTERAVFRGELRSIAISGDVYAAVIGRFDETHESVVGRLGGAAVVLGSALAVTPAAADDELVAITTETPLAVHVVRARGDGVARLSIPLLHESVLGLVLAHGRAYALSKRALDVVTTSDLPWERADASLPARFAPFVPRGRREPTPATVAMIVGHSILLDHPRLGRLRIVPEDGDPALEKDDEVVLEDVLEKLPGVFEVRRWRRSSGIASSHPPPPSTAATLPPPEVLARVVEPPSVPRV